MGGGQCVHMNIGAPGSPEEMGPLQLKSQVFVSRLAFMLGSSKAMHILTTELSLHPHPPSHSVLCNCWLSA